MRLDIREEFADGLMSLDDLLDMMARVERWTGEKPAEVWMTDAQHRTFKMLVSNLHPEWCSASHAFGMRILTPDVEWDWPHAASVA